MGKLPTLRDFEVLQRGKVMAEHVTVYEVGPRDGLQNEAGIIPAAAKIELVDLLSEAGFSKIEVTSFVSPKWVPQLGDASEVMVGIRRRSGTVYGVLTPNMKGFEAAVKARADEVAIFGSASESFAQKNINCTIAESLARFEPVARAAKTAGIPVRGYISCVTDCPFEGQISPSVVADVASQLMAMGCYEVSLGDTIGAGSPERVAALLAEVSKSVPPAQLAGHFHDTKGYGIANVEVSLDAGLRCFDSSVGGLGGCPYAPGAKGNLATGKLLDLLEHRGYHTGIDRAAYRRAEVFLGEIVGSHLQRNGALPNLVCRN